MVEYVDSTQGVSSRMLQGFFRGWRKPWDPQTHLEILENSDRVVLAVDAERDMVVGFVTALTDSVQAAFIPLLEVLPDYQRRGIGTELMRRMLKELERIPAIDVTCDRSVQPFYARLGMKPSVGMVVRDY